MKSEEKKRTIPNQEIESVEDAIAPACCVVAGVGECKRKQSTRDNKQQ